MARAKQALDNPPRSEQLAGLTDRYATILIDPPWRFANRTGKIAPEHKRLRRYPTMSMEEIAALPVVGHAAAKSHLYMWCPNALLLKGCRSCGPGGSSTKPTSFGTSPKDGGPMAAAWAFIFAMSPNCCCLA